MKSCWLCVRFNRSIRLISAISSVLQKELFVKRIAEIKNRRLNPGYSSYVPQVFMNHLSAQECGVLQEKLYKFPGFYIQNRTIREYEYPYGAHLLGNIGEVNQGGYRERSLLCAGR